MPWYRASMPAKRSDPLYQAQAILSRRDHSAAEIRQKLARKGFSPGEINQAVGWLTDNNLLDDAKFARTYTESMLRVKPVGPRWLKAKLRQKGIASAIIAETLAEAFALIQEEELARQAAARHAPGDKNRLYRFLLSRGFSNEVIERIV